MPLSNAITINKAAVVATLSTVLSTNWIPITVQSPNGDGTTRAVSKEVAVITSNRYANILLNGDTNNIHRVLVSSEVIPPPRFLVRDVPTASYTNWSGWGNWAVTNPYGTIIIR